MKGSTPTDKRHNRFSLRKLESGMINSETVPSLAFVGVAAVLYILLFDGGIFHLFIAMASGCLLVGYAILNILIIQKYFSKLEFFVFCFLTSIGFTGFLLIGLIYSGYIELGLSTSFLVIGIISLSVTIMTNGKKAVNSISRHEQPNSLSRTIDALAIGVCVGFYLVVAAVADPNAASLIGSDISRHLADSTTLFRTPDVNSAPVYLLFHSFQGSISILAGENHSMLLFLSSFAFLNIFIPLSVCSYKKASQLYRCPNTHFE